MADQALMKEHCFDCHSADKTKGKFELSFLGDGPDVDNLERWLDCLDLVTAEEMPPEDDSHLAAPDREKIIAYLDEKVRAFEKSANLTSSPKPRRLNNREFANGVRDVLLLEDIGTNLPMDNLIGDALHHGFDTHGDTLSFSRFHLEQYVEAVRKVVDATVFSGERPESKRYEIPAERIFRQQLSQNNSRAIEKGENGVFDFLDPKLAGYFPDFEEAPASGRYSIKISCMGKDRGIYDVEETGYYHDDPVQLSVHMGDRVKTFDLPDEKVIELELDEWIDAGTRVEMHFPTDAYTIRGNGNFKFQYGITPTHLKKYDPERYDELVSAIEKSPGRNKRKRIDTWHNWTDYWMGARPQVFSVEIEGPLYEAWPPKRQVALLGDSPVAANAADILRPIANRAWRRPVKDGELEKIVDMVKEEAKTMGDIVALKEGIVAVLVSPAFLMANLEANEPASRFASKLSFFLESTIPDQELRDEVGAGKLDSFEAVQKLIQSEIEKGTADTFLREFPFAWLELNDINFMGPDPEHYRFYHKKRLSEDMVDEVLEFFRYAVTENRPVPELLSADYSFINADLAKIYGVEDVPGDSKFRRYTFKDGRRGGLLGMGAFLTSTADSLATSPIHRAVYVMENMMGIHPTPPPPNVVIKEPDVRKASTIKEILAAHVSDENCASCHEAIDPWGYAFENFDPTGAWRDVYVVPVILETDENGDPIPSKKKDVTIPIDSSAKFRNGFKYQDITEFRNEILTDTNRDRFVKCFIEKLLTYANGAEPEESDFVAIDDILTKSAEHDYRIVETIAAVVNSPLFRGK
ncbi:MAG: DUF1588 domain-containing protein [Verrucomicrobiales bacterium]|nr:DUF1588 domain-containing protein [Verrucomicrobiales bacterium]